MWFYKFIVPLWYIFCLPPCNETFVCRYAIEIDNPSIIYFLCQPPLFHTRRNYLTLWNRSIPWNPSNPRSIPWTLSTPSMFSTWGAAPLAVAGTCRAELWGGFPVCPCRGPRYWVPAPKVWWWYIQCLCVAVDNIPCIWLADFTTFI